jgi:DMSO/TMAO reductase YedYZ heme-binding membrane subunit
VRLSPQARKVALTAHVTTSVGWLGAVAGVLALAIAGVSATDEQTVRGVYIAMRVTAWAVLVPLALASLVTGVLQALGTRWGLLRHYWVVTKLVITVIATAILLLYTRRSTSLPTRPPNRCGQLSTARPCAARRSSCTRAWHSSCSW